jgi:hypothetical protein
MVGAYTLPGMVERLVRSHMRVTFEFEAVSLRCRDGFALDTAPVFSYRYIIVLRCLA